MNDLAKMLDPGYCFNCLEEHSRWLPEFLRKRHVKKCLETNCQHRWTVTYHIYRDLNEVPLVCTGSVRRCRYCRKEIDGPEPIVVYTKQYAPKKI